jgi:hypothetical protein
MKNASEKDDYDATTGNPRKFTLFITFRRCTSAVVLEK